MNVDNQISDEVDFLSWLFSVLQSRNNIKKAEVITNCWAIWKVRNTLVRNKKKSPFNRVVAASIEYLTQWKEAQGRGYSVSLQQLLDGDGTSSWVKPQRNTIKVTVDATIFKDREAFGIGLVARDYTVRTVQARSKLFQGLVDPQVAEIMAIKEALSWLPQTNWTQVVIEFDCLTAV